MPIALSSCCRGRSERWLEVVPEREEQLQGQPERRDAEAAAECAGGGLRVAPQPSRYKKHRSSIPRIAAAIPGQN